MTVLLQKIEQMSYTIERLNSKFSLLEPPSTAVPSSKEGANCPPVIAVHRSPTQQLSDLPILDHKDVLVDDEYESRRDWPESMSESLLSPELQIQRLTAQLTAAYNRIAALEEQLLSKRIH